MMQLYKVSVQLFDGTVLEQQVAGQSVFGAVKFIQDECAKNAWQPAALHAQLVTEEDLQEVKPS